MIPREQLDHLERRHHRSGLLLVKCIVFLLIALVIGMFDAANDRRSTTLPSMLTPRYKTFNPYIPIFVIVQDEHTGAYSAISYYEYSGDPELQSRVWVFSDGFRAGFIAPWFQTSGLRLGLRTDPARSRSDADNQAIRHAVADALAIEQPWRSTKTINRFRQNDSLSTSVNPIYLLIDIAAIAAIVLAIRTRKKRIKLKREIRVLRLFLAEYCPKCKYDLSGIMHQATKCPECGQTLTLKP